MNAMADPPSLAKEGVRSGPKRRSPDASAERKVQCDLEDLIGRVSSTNGMLRRQSFATPRHRYLTTHGLEFLDLSFLLSAPEAITRLCRYVKATSCFSNLFS